MFLPCHYNWTNNNVKVTGLPAVVVDIFKTPWPYSYLITVGH